MSFVALLDESMRRCPDEVALIDGSRRWNYSAFSDAVRDAARGLTAVGVMQGDRLALHTLNWFELAVLYFACARLGGISVPVNTGLKPPGIDFVLRHCGVSTYIGTKDLIPPALARSERLAAVKRSYLLDRSDGPDETLTYEALFA